VLFRSLMTVTAAGLTFATVCCVLILFSPTLMLLIAGAEVDDEGNIFYNNTHEESTSRTLSPAIERLRSSLVMRIRSSISVRPKDSLVLRPRHEIKKTLEAKDEDLKPVHNMQLAGLGNQEQAAVLDENINQLHAALHINSIPNDNAVAADNKDMVRRVSSQNRRVGSEGSLPMLLRSAVLSSAADSESSPVEKVQSISARSVGQIVRSMSMEWTPPQPVAVPYVRMPDQSDNQDHDVDDYIYKLDDLPTDESPLKRKSIRMLDIPQGISSSSKMSMLRKLDSKSSKNMVENDLTVQSLSIYRSPSKKPDNISEDEKER